MQHIIYIDQARRLSVELGCLTIVDSDEEHYQLHTNDILAVVIESHYCQISTPALLLCVENNIPVIFCDEKHQPQIYCIDYYRHCELLSRLNQQIKWPKERQFQAWLIIIEHKLQHQLELLQDSQVSQDKIDLFQSYKSQLELVAIGDGTINTIESISARIYFNTLFGDEFKRFEADPLNHALNYGYALIRSLIMVALTIKGLHPALGIWHHSVRNRFNLADDMIEVLRPLVDRAVYHLDIEQELTKTHRQQLLSILHQEVYWQGKSCSLRQVINLFLDDFIKFMNGECDIMSCIKLRENSAQNEPK